MPIPKATTCTLLSRPRRATLAMPYRHAMPTLPRTRCRPATMTCPDMYRAANVPTEPINRYPMSSRSRNSQYNMAVTAAAAVP